MAVGFYLLAPIVDFIKMILSDFADDRSFHGPGHSKGVQFTFDILCIVAGLVITLKLNRKFFAALASVSLLALIAGMNSAAAISIFSSVHDADGYRALSNIASSLFIAYLTSTVVFNWSVAVLVILAIQEQLRKFKEQEIDDRQNANLRAKRTRAAE